MSYRNVYAGILRLQNESKNVFWTVSFSLVKIQCSDQLFQKSFDIILERLQISKITESSNSGEMEERDVTSGEALEIYD